MELRAPQSSQLDQYFIEKAFNRREVFPSVVEPGLRADLLNNIRRIPLLIPTLRTFFDHTIYLEPCCHALKLLIGPTEKMTIRQSLFASYQRPEHNVVEYEEGCFRSMERGSPKSERLASYLQLWLFAMRHLPELVSFKCLQALPKKENGETKPSVVQENAAVQGRFADLAKTLGFSTSQINELQGRNSDEAQTRSFLKHTRPFSNTGMLTKEIDQILEILRSIPKRFVPEAF